MYCQLPRIMLLQLITYVVQLLNWMPLTLLLSLPCFEPLLEPHFSSSVVESNSNFLQWSPPCEYSPLQYLSDAVASSSKEDWNTRVASCQRMKEKRNVLGCLLPSGMLNRSLQRLSSPFYNDCWVGWCHLIKEVRLYMVLNMSHSVLDPLSSDRNDN